MVTALFPAMPQNTSSAALRVIFAQMPALL
jgi:hypothetical protein